MVIFVPVMIVKAENIHKSFGDLHVLKGVHFHAEKGEIVAITGPSGAGKSTLLQILGTLCSPDEGSLEIDGTPVRSLGRDGISSWRGRKIGFVFQEHHLLPEFTALENVMIPALISGASGKEAKLRATELLQVVGLSGRTDHKPAQLSGGESQRVAIARALINSPAVIFADEPTGNLDSVTKSEIHKLIFSLREKFGQTFIIVTHDPELAALCDRSLRIVDGNFV